MVAADLDGYFQVQLVQEADKSFLAETVKLCAHQGGNFRLFDAERFGRFRLCVALFFEDFHNLAPERRTGEKLIRIIKAHIPEDVPASVHATASNPCFWTM